MPENFTLDPKMQRLAEAYALDAVDFAATLDLTLDWSDASIGDIEAIAAELHKSTSTSKPSRERVWTMAKMLGSYVGEVYRRNHGAEWGLSSLFGGETGALRASADGSVFSPWAKVMMRLENGDEDNVAAYYHWLTRPRSGPDA